MVSVRSFRLKLVRNVSSGRISVIVARTCKTFPMRACSRAIVSAPSVALAIRARNASIWVTRGRRAAMRDSMSAPARDWRISGCATTANASAAQPQAPRSSACFFRRARGVVGCAIRMVRTVAPPPGNSSRVGATPAWSRNVVSASRPLRGTTDRRSRTTPARASRDCTSKPQKTSSGWNGVNRSISYASTRCRSSAAASGSVTSRSSSQAGGGRSTIGRSRRRCFSRRRTGSMPGSVRRNRSLSVSRRRRRSLTSTTARSGAAAGWIVSTSASAGPDGAARQPDGTRSRICATHQFSSSLSKRSTSAH